MCSSDLTRLQSMAKAVDKSVEQLDQVKNEDSTALMLHDQDGEYFSSYMLH